MHLILSFILVAILVASTLGGACSGGVQVCCGSSSVGCSGNYCKACCNGVCGCFYYRSGTCSSSQTPCVDVNNPDYPIRDGNCNYRYVPSPTTTRAPNNSTNGIYGPIDSFDRPGRDLVGQPITASSAQDCQTKCYRNRRCLSWAFDSCGTSCWLKSSSPAKAVNSCRKSGVITASRN
ncbi:dnaG [Acrasis kona]|uniref:DnaG n=1 Tax=Acrasis kona TaxID=1008807 RepID=A0AAW2YSP4_9EUKA